MKFSVCALACVRVRKCMICASYVKALCIIRQQRKVVWDDGDERGRETAVEWILGKRERGCVYASDTHTHTHAHQGISEYVHFYMKNY